MMSTEPQTGKTVVALGLLEGLTGHALRVALFRPLVRESDEPDRLIQLAIDRYQIPRRYDELYGATYAEARDLLTSGRREELLARILERYHALVGACDAVVCVGTDFRGISAPIELDFNIDVARNLGAGLIPVVRALDRTPEQIANAARVTVELLREHHCEPLALVVNRAEPAGRDAIQTQLLTLFPGGMPINVLPEHPLLNTPSVREVAQTLGAELISGDPARLDGEVRRILVGAMQLPHFLDHLCDGSLVVTPGDRCDILLGALAASFATGHPHIAGLVLTGGLRPEPQIQRLLRGLGPQTVPILAVQHDTFLTATQLVDVTPSISSGDTRRISAALGLTESSLDVAALLRRASLTASNQRTPLMFQLELFERARRQRRHIVLPEGAEERILRAAEIVRLRDICDLTLLGKVDTVRRRISALGLALDGIPVLDPSCDERRRAYADLYQRLRAHKGVSPELAYDTLADVSYFGTMMVQNGDADGMVSGSVHTTAHTIRPALEVIRTRDGISIISSVFFMCLTDRVLVYGDCAINPDPTADQLAEIAVCAADTAAAFGIEPRVAMLSYSTGESGKGPEVEKVREATSLSRQRRPDLLIEGPIQYDAAIDPEVARLKLPDSRIAGQATVFIFPDLNAGNAAYKAVQRAAGALAIGPVLQGLRKPVNDLSRGATVADIVLTIAITAIQSQSHPPRRNE